MKVFFIVSSIYILYLMRIKYKATYNPGLDTFRYEFLLAGAAVFGIMFSYNYAPVEVNRLFVTNLNNTN